MKIQTKKVIFIVLGFFSLLICIGSMYLITWMFHNETGAWWEGVTEFIIIMLGIIGGIVGTFGCFMHAHINLTS